MKENNKFSSLMPQRNVDGFDPMTALTKSEETNDNGQVVERYFLPTQVAMEWFLTVYPEGCFNHTVQITDRKCIAHASIYRNVNDTRAAATATCTKMYDDTDAGKFYEQNAVTAAYRKALEYLGFGAPIGVNAENDDGRIGMVSDVNESTTTVIKPVSIPKNEMSSSVKAPDVDVSKNLSKDETDDKSTKTTRGRGRKTTKANADVSEKETSTVAPPTSVVNCMVDDEPVDKEELADTQSNVSAVQVNPQQEDTVQPDVPPEEEEEPELPDNEGKMPKTLDEAKKVVITRGKLAGMTIEDAANEYGNDYIRHYYEYLKRTEIGTILITALRVFCEFTGC